MRPPPSSVSLRARHLLIGNSRWHWAGTDGGAVVFWHGPPDVWPGDVAAVSGELRSWASVGPEPRSVALPRRRQRLAADVPLREQPPWLGVDRALAGWEAWCRRGEEGGGVLVADAGTVLSLTVVTEDGCFAGGRLAAGLRLQLEAMAGGTRDLPGQEGQEGGAPPAATAPWPRRTAAAMRLGSAMALAGAIHLAAADLPRRTRRWSVWLTGGDAPALRDALAGHPLPGGAALRLAPDLVMEGLMRLDQESPRSSSS